MSLRVGGRHVSGSGRVEYEAWRVLQEREIHGGLGKGKKQGE